MRLGTRILPALVALAAAVALPQTTQAASEAAALKQLSNPVANDAMLKGFVGSWKGDGTVRRTAGDREEAVQCKLSNAWTAGNKILKMNLLCRGLDYQFTATGYVGRSGSTYRGSMQSSATGESNVSGKKSGNGLAFNVVTTGQAGTTRSTMTIKNVSGGVVNTVQRTDPATGQRYTALNVTMRR